MSQTSREILGERLHEILDDATKRHPEAMLVSIPVGRIVEAAHEVLMDDGIPRVPPHDPDYPRVFSTSFHLPEPGQAPDWKSVSVRTEDEQVQIALNHNGTETTVPLDVTDAEAFFLAGLAAVRHLRTPGTAS